MTSTTRPSRWTVVLVLCGLVAAMLAARTAVSARSSGDQVIAGTDRADAYVSESRPAHHYGHRLMLIANRHHHRRHPARTRGSRRIYLRFAVAGIPAGSRIDGVILHIHAAKASSSGFTVRSLRSAAAWSERRITWKNQPGVGATVYGRQRTIAKAGWLNVPLSGSVGGNGTYNFVLVGAGAATVHLNSRESARDPVLRVSVPPVVPSPSPSPSLALARPGLASPPLLPQISGSPVDGSTLSVTQGSYTGSPAPDVADSWQRCAVDSDGQITTCTAVGTGPSYLLGSADVGNRIEVVETASNGVGAPASQTSAPTAVVRAIPPTNTARPTISGSAVESHVLTASTGSWSGSQPITFAYRWRRCASGECANISTNAKKSSYTVTSADVGYTLVVRVTATNAGGSDTADSAPTAVVTGTGGSSGDPVIAAAGDIACDPSSSGYNNGSGTSDTCREKYTAALLAGISSLGAVLPLGDNAYYCGSLDSFTQSYQPTWGQFMSITHPTVGNHEYLTSGGTGCTSSNANAAGYFNYFGSRAGTSAAPYYSWNIGAWHMISLDSNCANIGGCDTSSPQGKWLASDLAANHSQCTLAYWHIPLYSSGGRAEDNAQSLYDQLYRAGADVILTGHDHTYERFAPQDANGDAVANGITEFVVGTGGANHTSLASRQPNSVVFNDTTFGVLRMTLHATSYDWKFVPDTGSGSFTDSGSASCH